MGEDNNKIINDTTPQKIEDVNSDNVDNILEKLRKLEPKDTKAIQMRYEGESAKSIAGAIGLTSETINTYFGRGGRLNKLYRDYADYMNNLLLEEAKDGMSSSVNAATSVLISLLSGRDEIIKDEKGIVVGIKRRMDNVRLNAAKEILDRVLGKAEQKIKFEDETDDVSKLMERFKLKPEDLSNENRDETIRRILQGITSGEGETKSA